MAYALKSEKWYWTESPTTFSSAESSPESNFYFCPKSFLSIQRVFEFKVKQLPISKATIFTPCKHAGMFICTTHVENR